MLNQCHEHTKVFFSRLLFTQDIYGKRVVYTWKKVCIHIYCMWYTEGQVGLNVNKANFSLFGYV